MNMRQKQAKAAKAKIIKKAFKLFDTQGCGNVSVGDICKAAKISNGAFYHYFSSKDQLIVMYVNQPLQEELERVVIPEIGKMSTKELLFKFLDIVFSDLKGRGMEWYKTYFISSLNLGKNDSYVQSMPYHALLQILKEGLERGELSAVYDEKFYADYLFSILNGITIGWTQQAGESDLLSNGELFFEFAYKSISSD
jgi:AcrR family transcriptional regulator